MNLRSAFRKLLGLRNPCDLQKWARENFNIHDIDTISGNEIANEIRNFTVRYSMYMEGDNDSRRLSLVVSILALVVSVAALIVSFNNG